MKPSFDLRYAEVMGYPESERSRSTTRTVTLMFRCVDPAWGEAFARYLFDLTKEACDDGHCTFYQCSQLATDE